MKHLSLIRSIADHQYGVVARFQLLDHGCDQSSVTRLAHSGYLEQAGNGVFTTLRLKRLWHQKAMIAVLSYGRNALLSHESVLTYYGLLSPRSKRWSGSHRGYALRPIHVLAKDVDPHDNSVLHQTIDIQPCDIYRPSIGLAHVSLARAFVDATYSLTDAEVDFALEKAFYKGLVSPREISAAISRAPNGCGRQKRRLSKLLRPYLVSWEEGKVLKPTESILEKRIQRAIEKYIHCECVPQFEVYVDGKKYRLDFALPEHKVAVEVDSFEYHRSRDKFDADRVRQNALVGQGWKFVRVTAAFSDEQIAQQVLSVLYSD